MIVPIGGKHVFCHALSAYRNVGRGQYYFHTTILDVADSEAEGFERAMEAARRAFPNSAGWKDHEVTTRDLTGIVAVGRLDLDDIKAQV